jgi:hypothetical protein
MRASRPIVVSIDGQEVRLLVRPLTVAATTALVALGASRGPSATITHAPGGLSLIASYVDLPAGQVTVDDRPVESAEELVRLFSGRQEVLYRMHQAVIATTRLSDAERRELTVAVRFLWWLPSAVGQWKETGASCRKCIDAGLCGSRGCDGTTQVGLSGKPRAVWHDAKLVVNVCPVRSLTPAVEAVLVWFSACYGAQEGRYRRIALPDVGGVGHQDAWLLDAMAHVAHVRNELLHEHERAGSARSTPADDGDGD